jgi:hypothetical protein
MGVRAQVQMTVRLGDAADAILPAVQRGVELASERLLALSAERVPLDQGTLQTSGAVSMEETVNGDPVGVVSYDTPYAARLHEHPEYRFQNGRQGKYLEGPAVEHKKELGDIIRKEVADALGEGS